MRQVRLAARLPFIMVIFSLILPTCYAQCDMWYKVTNDIVTPFKVEEGPLICGTKGLWLYQWFPESGPRTRNINITWEVVRNAKVLRLHSNLTESETLNVELRIQCLRSPADYSHVHSCLRISYHTSRQWLEKPRETRLMSNRCSGGRDPGMGRKQQKEKGHESE